MPRLRFYHWKLIILILLALCCYMSMSPAQREVDESPKSTRKWTVSGNVKSANKEILPITLSRQKKAFYERSIREDLEKQQPGLGADGKAAQLAGAAKERGVEFIETIAINVELSDSLAYNRTIPDSRHPKCLKQHYDVQSLPSASVIIIFYNEPYSVLVRTIHSTLNTCNRRVLKEIILVDDGSTNMELVGKLNYYIKTRLPRGKVQVLRLEEHSGLVRARLAGAHIATGDVLVFLDAHCEAVIGWCEPLLQRINDTRSRVVMPIIDTIDPEDFHYGTNGYDYSVGGFNWDGFFDWIDVPKREKRRHMHECKEYTEICPARSPTMPGGLFAIDREYFWQIGSYDEQMIGWGGENLEMSFRIWQCGGTIEIIPCSRVGHVFRRFNTQSFPELGDTHGINTVRLATVWMDDYIKILYLNRPDLLLHFNIGNVTQRLTLRKQLQCKSFDWYLKHVYPEKFLPTQNVIAYGRIQAVGSKMCLNDNSEDFKLKLCRKQLEKSQLFSYTKKKVLRNEFRCFEVQKVYGTNVNVVQLVSCMANEDYHDHWLYEQEHFRHMRTNTCLDHVNFKDTHRVFTATCDLKSGNTQRWTIYHD